MKLKNGDHHGFSYFLCPIPQDVASVIPIVTLLVDEIFYDGYFGFELQITLLKILKSVQVIAIVTSF